MKYCPLNHGVDNEPHTAECMTLYIERMEEQLVLIVPEAAWTLYEDTGNESVLREAMVRTNAIETGKRYVIADVGGCYHFTA